MERYDAVYKESAGEKAKVDERHGWAYVDHQVLALKLKASGKELDPWWFNVEEAEKFKESDRKEWEAWVKKGVIQRLTKEQAAADQKKQCSVRPCEWFGLTCPRIRRWLERV